MKGEELGKLLLDGLLVAQNGRMVAHYCVHVGPERVHVLANGDLVLLGLIPIRIKSGGQVMYLVLQCSRRTDRVLLLEWWWWWGVVDDYPTSPWALVGIPNLDWYALSSSSLLESYTSSGLGTPGLSFLTIISLIGCI